LKRHRRRLRILRGWQLRAEASGQGIQHDTNRLPGCPAAVDDQGRTGHEAGCMRGQEDDCSPKFLWPAPAAKWDVIEKELVSLRVIHNGDIHISCERTRAQGVYCNVVWGPFKREHPG